MTRSVYINGSSVSLELTLEELKAALESKAGLLWVDIPHDEDPVPILRDVFNFHPLAIED